MFVQVITPTLTTPYCHTHHLPRSLGLACSQKTTPITLSNLLGHDPNRQIQKIELTTNGQTRTIVENISYLPFGPIKSWVWGNGKNYTASYDLDYRLTAQTTTGLTNPAIVAK